MNAAWTWAAIASLFLLWWVLLDATDIVCADIYRRLDKLETMEDAR